MTRLGNRHGLTLIELVVSLTVTGLALAAGYGAFATIIDLRSSSIEATDKALQSAAIRRALRSLVAGARLTTDPDGPAFRGLDGVHEGAPDDALVFLTTGATPLDAPETVVRLRIDHDEETPEHGLIAEFAEWRGSGVSKLEIDPHVSGLETRYLSTILGRREWRPSWISSSILPAAVEIRLIAGEGDSLPALLEFPLLVPIAGGR